MCPQELANYRLRNEAYAARERLTAGTQFTCFTSTKVQILTPLVVSRLPARAATASGAAGASVLDAEAVGLNSHITCCTPLSASLVALGDQYTHCTCFASTKV